ncbi:hypothetical protein N9Y89_01930 [bacterium]|nr:hypothetical protein [bacterium]
MSGKDYTILVLGNKEDLDLKALGEYGEVKFLDSNSSADFEISVQVAVFIASKNNNMRLTIEVAIGQLPFVGIAWRLVERKLSCFIKTFITLNKHLLGSNGLVCIFKLVISTLKIQPIMLAKPRGS